MRIIQKSISNPSIPYIDGWTLSSVISAFVVVLWLFPHELDGLKYDDAFITFRYTENLVNGAGLVFNEGDRVSAASSLSYVLVLAALKFVLPFDLVTLATIIGLFSTIVLLRGLGSLTAELKLSSFASGAVIFGVATSPVYLYWAASGMETSLFVASAVVAVYLWVSSRHTSLVAVSFVFLILTRPEGVIVPLCLLAASIGTRGRISTRDLVLSGSVVLSLVSWIACHRVYYGNWLPNSAYNRGQIVGYDGSNFEHLSLWADRIGFSPEFIAISSFVLAAAIWIGVLIRKSPIKRFVDIDATIMQFGYLLFAGLFALIGFGISLLGPKADLHRYILQYVPFVLIFGALLAQVSRLHFVQVRPIHPNLIWGYRIGLVVILVAVFIHYVGVVEPITNHWYEHANKRRSVGDWARSHIPADVKILSSDVGMVGYRMIDHELVDVIGLTSGLWRNSDLRQEHEKLNSAIPSGMWIVDTRWPSGEIQAVEMLNSPGKFLVHWPSDAPETRSEALTTVKVIFETSPAESGHKFVAGVISK